MSRFTMLLIEFTTENDCTKLWLETVVEWIKKEINEHKSRRWSR